MTMFIWFGCIRSFLLHSRVSQDVGFDHYAKEGVAQDKTKKLSQITIRTNGKRRRLVRVKKPLV